MFTLPGRLAAGQLGSDPGDEGSNPSWATNTLRGQLTAGCKFLTLVILVRIQSPQQITLPGQLAEGCKTLTLDRVVRIHPGQQTSNSARRIKAKLATIRYGQTMD